MFKFESVETKSNEFRMAYSELMDKIGSRMASDEAFALTVRQAISEALYAYVVTKAVPNSGYFRPTHAYKLGRYSTPDLYLYGCHAYSKLSDLDDVTDRLYYITQAVTATFSSLSYITREEDPIRWFSGFSKCSYWESLSTAILGVSDEETAEAQPVALASTKDGSEYRIRRVGLSAAARGFAYPLMALQYLLRQLQSLRAGIAVRPVLATIPGVRDYISQIDLGIDLLSTSIDNTADMMNDLMED